MRLTGQLGTPNSLLGNILLGVSGDLGSLAGAASGSATITGGLTFPDVLANGEVDGSGTLTGRLTKPARAMAGSCSGGSTLTGTLTGGHAVVPGDYVSIGGWGDEAWGSDAWGGGGTSVAGFGFTNAVAVAENVIRLEFTEPVYFSGYLDAPDASNPKRFTVQAIAGSVGYDGDAARPVNAVQVQLAPVVSGYGRFLDVYLDRPMSPYPAQYAVGVSNVLVSANSKDPIDPASLLMVTFYGLFRKLIPPTLEQALPSLDIANPQSGGLAANDVQALLGTYSVDETGDYGNDSGIPNLKKRILRRLMTRKGAFAHMPDYGVGLVEEGKQLNTGSTRERLRAECERQIMLEPDVDRVSVQIVVDSNIASLVRFIILVKTKAGERDKFEIPLQRAA